jgi:hypothetical protein
MIIANFLGLYFKLHGRHRPIEMKKGNGEIKRRKRVVPAPSPSQLNASHGHQSSQSPQVSMENTEPFSPLHSSNAPMPVDFTTYRPTSPSSSTATGGAEHPDAKSHRGRKRAHEDTNMTPTQQLQAEGVSRDEEMEAEKSSEKKWLQTEREKLLAQLAAVDAQLATRRE